MQIDVSARLDGIDECLCPAIFKRARRLQVLKLQKEFLSLCLDGKNGRHKVAERDGFRNFLPWVAVQMEKSAALAAIRMTVNGVFFFTFFTIKIHIKNLRIQLLCSLLHLEIHCKYFLFIFYKVTCSKTVLYTCSFYTFLLQ